MFARIEGEKTRRIKVALNTGATFVMIPWEVAEILGYNPGASPKKRKIITASGIQHVPVVELESMSILEMEAHNVEALVHNLHIVNRDEILTETDMLNTLDAIASREKGNYYKYEDVFE